MIRSNQTGVWSAVPLQNWFLPRNYPQNRKRNARPFSARRVAETIHIPTRIVPRICPQIDGVKFAARLAAWRPIGRRENEGGDMYSFGNSPCKLPTPSLQLNSKEQEQARTSSLKMARKKRHRLTPRPPRNLRCLLPGPMQ